MNACECGLPKLFMERAIMRGHQRRTETTCRHCASAAAQTPKVAANRRRRRRSRTFPSVAFLLPSPSLRLSLSFPSSFPPFIPFIPTGLRATTRGSPPPPRWRRAAGRETGVLPGIVKSWGSCNSQNCRGAKFALYFTSMKWDIDFSLSFGKKHE